MSRPIAVPRDRFSPVAVALVAVVATAIYANAIANGFVLDDRWVVLDNDLVHRVSGLWRAWVNPYWPPEHPAGQYRPLAIVGFTLDWMVSRGDPRWFHAMNVVWHAAASVLVWALLRRLLSPAGALLGGLLFAVHPVHVEAVSNVVGRAESMAAVFAAATVLAHARRSWWAVPLFALALASKESAIVVPGLVALWDILIERDPRVALRESRARYIAYAVVVAAFGATLLWVFGGRPMVDVAVVWNNATVGDRLLTMLGVIPHYVRLLVAPAWLSADYNPRVVNLATGLTPMVLLGAALLVLWTVATAAAWQRSRRIAFGLLWIPIALAPVANVVFPSGIVLAERTLYLPSVGACLLLGAAFEHLALRRAAVTVAAAAIALALLGARTWTRTPIWRSNRTLILTTAEEHPESYKIHHRLAGILMNLRDTAGANREYAIATRLYAGDPYLYREIAEAALRQGDPRRAVAALDTAIALMPEHPSPHLRMADAFFLLGEWARSFAAARQAWTLEPDSVRAIVVMGAAARASGDPARARDAYRQGLTRHSRNWELHAGLAETELLLGDSAAAERASAEAVRLSAGDPVATAIRARIIGENRRDSAVGRPGILQDTVQNTGTGQPRRLP